MLCAKLRHPLPALWVQCDREMLKLLYRGSVCSVAFFFSSPFHFCVVPLSFSHAAVHVDDYRKREGEQEWNWGGFPPVMIM